MQDTEYWARSVVSVIYTERTAELFSCCKGEVYLLGHHQMFGRNERQTKRTSPRSRIQSLAQKAVAKVFPSHQFKD